MVHAEKRTSLENNATHTGKRNEVDDEDCEKFSKNKYRFVAGGGRKTGYALRVENEKLVFLHKEIMKTPKGMVCDHIDGDTLNNQKSNLRNCTPKENARNTARRSDNETGYKGVYKRDERIKNPFRARIKVDGVTLSLGAYPTPQAAAVAYNAAATKYFGEFSKLNQVTQGD